MFRGMTIYVLISALSWASHHVSRATFAITRTIRFLLPCANASMAPRIWDSTRPPICRTPERRVSRSLSYCLERCSVPIALLLSAEPAGDVVFRFFLLRLDENLVGHAEFHHLSEIHIRRVVRNARRLLPVVSDDHDRIVVLQLVHELLDAARRDRVESRGRLVQEQHLGLDGDPARNAQPLLLAAREAGAALPQLVLHFVPERRFSQSPFDALLHLARRKTLV